MKQRCQYTPHLTKLSQKWGVLDLDVDANRLSFTTDDGTEIVSGPLEEFHSPRNFVARGITVYQGADRFKFDFSSRDPNEAARSAVAIQDPVLLAGTAGKERDTALRAKLAARAWTTELREVLSDTPPPGVHVKNTMGPEDRTKFQALMVLVGLGIGFVCVGLVLAVVIALA